MRAASREEGTVKLQEELESNGILVNRALPDLITQTLILFTISASTREEIYI